MEFQATDIQYSAEELLVTHCMKGGLAAVSDCWITIELLGIRQAEQTAQFTFRKMD